MIIKLDGIKREPTVSAKVPWRRKAIVWARGEDGTIAFTLRDEYGKRVNLTNCFLFLAIRKLPIDQAAPTAAAVYRQATPIDVANGRATFTIAAADTLGFTEGVSYHYDVLFVDAAGARWQVVPDSSWFVAPINAEPGSVPTTPALPAPLIPLFGPPVATWDAAPENARRYALDPVGGIDTAVGYADGLSSAAWQAAAPGVAVKTWKRLREVLPPGGFGRSAVIYIKGNPTTGVSLFKVDGVTLDNLDLRGLVGYYEIRVEPTFDWSESLADKLKCGGVIDAAGPNGDGSWSVAAGSTASVLNIAGATPLPAKASLLGKRIRFKGNVTAGLLNYNAAAYRRNSDTQVTSAYDNAVVPAVGDDLFIERPGIIANDVYANESQCGRLNIAGFKFTQATIPAAREAQCAANVHFAFCQFDVYLPRIRGADTYNLSFSYTERTAETAVSRIVGPCRGRLAHTAATSCNGVGFTYLFVMDVASNIEIAINCPVFNYFGGYMIRSTLFRSVGQSNPFSPGGRSTIGIGAPSATIRPLWIDGNQAVVNGGIVLIGQCHVNIWGVDINNMGTIACVLIQCTNSTVGINGLLSTDGSNTGPSVSLSVDPPPSDTVIYFGNESTNASIGSLCDIIGAGAVKVSFAQLLDIDFVDAGRNRLVGKTTGFEIPQNAAVQQGMLMQSAEGAATGLLGQSVRADGTGKFLLAQANNAANAAGYLGVLANQALAGEFAMVVPDGFAVVRFASAPPALGPAYLSEATAGMAAAAAPALAGTSQKLRLATIAKQLASPLAICRLKPDVVSVTSDGNP